MIRILARVVLVLFVVLLIVAPAALILGARSEPTHEAVTWLEIAPPKELIGDTPALSEDEFVTDQIAFLASDIVMEPAWARTVKAKRLAPNADNPCDSLRQRCYVARVGQRWVQLSVRGTKAEMPACESFANALAETYLDLQAERADQANSLIKSVLNNMQHLQTSEVTRLIQDIDALQQRAAADKQKPSSTSSATAKARVALLQLRLDGAMQALKQIDQQQRRLWLQSEISQVRLLRKAHVQQIKDHGEVAQPLSQFIL